MASPENVQSILAAGREQTVGGCRICVETFQQTAKPSESSTMDGDSTIDTLMNVGSEQGSGSRTAGSEEGSDKSPRPKGSGSGSGSHEKNDSSIALVGGSNDSQSAEGSQEVGSGSDKSPRDEGSSENCMHKRSDSTTAAAEGRSVRTDSQLVESSEKTGSGTEGAASAGRIAR